MSLNTRYRKKYTQGHTFYRLIKYNTLILVKKSDLLSIKKYKQKDLFSFVKMIIFLNLDLAEKYIFLDFWYRNSA